MVDCDLKQNEFFNINFLATSLRVTKKLLDKLTKKGRLVDIEIKDCHVGKTILYQRYSKKLAKNYLFDAYIYNFNGFKKIQNFNI